MPYSTSRRSIPPVKMKRITNWRPMEPANLRPFSEG
jgi:hypothetical protein